MNIKKNYTFPYFPNKRENLHICPGILSAPTQLIVALLYFYFFVIHYDPI
jgi:hypothetical protein